MVSSVQGGRREWVERVPNLVGLQVGAVVAELRDEQHGTTIWSDETCSVGDRAETHQTEVPSLRHTKPR